MDWESKLRQTAVYWPPGPAGRTDRPRYGAPVELRPASAGGAGGVRWEDTVELVKDASGRDVASSAQVWVVALKPAVGGRLYLGALASLTDDQRADPAAVDNALCRPVVRSGAVPSVDASEVVYRAWL